MAFALASLVLLVILAGALLFWFRSRSSKVRQKEVINAQPSREPTFATLRPGDAIIFWDDTDALVRTVLECEEHLGNRETRWRWVHLDDGKVIEVNPMGKMIYTPVSTFYQGTAPFADLTADADQGGVLKSFEEKVRAGTIARDPVYFLFDGTRYQMKSTGTFVATASGEDLPPGPWSDISPEEGDNVYYKMSFGGTAPFNVGGEALGIWTTHIAFLAGKSLVDSDIKGIFSK